MKEVMLMKKNISKIFIAAILILLLSTGCNKEVTNKKEENLTSDLSSIMKEIYSNSKIPEDELPILVDTNITDENKEYYLGSSNISIKDGLASEPAVGSVAHSVVLIRIDDLSKIETVKNTIKENINPYKWICVGVEKKDVIVDSYGDIVILIMSSNSTKLHEGFKKVIS